MLFGTKPKEIIFKRFSSHKKKVPPRNCSGTFLSFYCLAAGGLLPCGIFADGLFVAGMFGLLRCISLTNSLLN
jgi:hypothetical protein